MDVERECSVIRDWRYIMWMWRGNVVLSETGDMWMWRGNFSVIRDWRYIMWMWRGNVVLSETGDISCGCGEGM